MLISEFPQYQHRQVISVVELPASKFVGRRPGRGAGVRPFGRVFGSAIVFLTLLGAALALQWMHRAYSAPFGAYPDEASHVVTSLLYRQFALTPSFDPIEFAKHYYGHYPFLAAGHWPPGFHAFSAAWMVLAGAGRGQILFYLALVAASIGTLLYGTVRRTGGGALAAVFCTIWILLAQSQAAITRFMTEGQAALLTFAAVCAYVRYLRAPDYSRSALFGVLAAAAVLTKETALALSLVPLASLALTDNRRLRDRGHFWLPAGIVSVVVGTWHAWVGWSQVGRFSGGSVVRIFLDRGDTLLDRATLFVDLLGWPLLVLTVVGLLAGVMRRDQVERTHVLWAVNGSLVIGGLLFHFAVPESKEVRHLYHLVPSFVVLAALGAQTVVSRVRDELRPSFAGLVALVCLVPASPSFTLPQKTENAAAEVVRTARLLTQDDDARVILISASSAAGEGPLISEFASLEPAPQRHLIRASKTLYRASWMGDEYEQLITGAAAVKTFLEESGVDTIVCVGEGAERRPDQVWLSEALDRQAAWKRIESDIQGVGIYRRLGGITAATKPIRLHTAIRLGSDLHVEPHHHATAGGSGGAY